MKVYEEISLNDFEFWGSAIQTAKYLTDDEMDAIEENLNELNPCGMSKTDINEFFWFDDDTIAEWLGYPDFKTLMSERKEDAPDFGDEEEEE